MTFTLVFIMILKKMRAQRQSVWQRKMNTRSGGIAPTYYTSCEDDDHNNNNNNNKVNRCLARYSPRATTTNLPTNRALNKPAWPGPN